MSSNVFKLYTPTIREQYVLRNFSVSHQSPGTILTTFESILNYIRFNKIPVNSTGSFISGEQMKNLSDQLGSPYSFTKLHEFSESSPDILGLYMLLRTTGLGITTSGANEKLLIVDEDVLLSWQSLNLTERYFTLLEAWLLKGASEIIGLHDTEYTIPGEAWRKLFELLPEEGLKVENSDTFISIIENTGAYNFHLMHQFGFIEIRSKTEIYSITEGFSVHKTQFGEAIKNLLIDYISSEDFIDFYLCEDPNQFGFLQPILRPFFHEYQNILVLPEVLFYNGTFIFKVYLKKSWRTIAIPAVLPLNDLSNAILDSFGFDDRHLHQFSYTNRFGMTEYINHQKLEDPPFSSDILIGVIPIKPGSSMSFVYDFSEKWNFKVTLERINPPDESILYPVLIDSYGSAPVQYPENDTPEN